MQRVLLAGVITAIIVVVLGPAPPLLHGDRPMQPPDASLPTVRLPEPPRAAPAMPRMPAPRVPMPADPWVSDDFHVEGPDKFDPLIARASALHLPVAEVDGIPTQVWLKAQMMQESSGNPRAESGTGPAGLMQLSIATGKRLKVRDRFDPAQSIDGGARYLAWCYDQWKGWDRTPEQRLPLAQVCYAEGMGPPLDAQRNPQCGGIYFEDFRPCLPEQGQLYPGKIKDRILSSHH